MDKIVKDFWIFISTLNLSEFQNQGYYYLQDTIYVLCQRLKLNTFKTEVISHSMNSNLLLCTWNYDKDPG